MLLAADAGTGQVPVVAALVVSLASLLLTFLGILLGNRAQSRTIASQTKAEQVKAEQHLVEILQAETTRLRTDHAADLARMRADNEENSRHIREECTERVNSMKGHLRQEREAHDRTRQQYREDMTALKIIVRDEITKAASSLMDEDVRDLIRPATPPTEEERIGDD